MGVHGICMIAAYGFMIQIAEIIANQTALQTALKAKYFNKHPEGYKRFNIHRTLGGASLLFALIGIIAIFVGYGTKVFDYGRHAIYGLIMVGLTILQIGVRIALPTADGTFHRWLGRFICFWAFWCMYTGKEADLMQDGKEVNVEGKYWLTYVLFLVFYGIRLYFLAKRCSQKEGEGHVDMEKEVIEDDENNNDNKGNPTGTDIELKQTGTAKITPV